MHGLDTYAHVLTEAIAYGNGSRIIGHRSRPARPRRGVPLHSLRHTFITNLARGGVHPKLDQDLARHSDINLTLSRYTHTLLGERAKALAALPDLSKDNTEAMRKTGTDGKTAGKPTVVFPSCFPEFQRLEANSVDSGGLRGDEPEDAQTPAQQESPPFSATKSTKPPNGLEPLTCGVQNRCSAN